MLKTKPLLLVCDIDGTLLHPELDNLGLVEFGLWLEKRRNRVIFAVNSGRGISDIALVAENGPLPRPDWIISNMGTSVSSGFTQDSRDPDWTILMDRDWGRENIRKRLSSCPGLIEQEGENQHPAKLSYYLEGDVSSIMKEVRARLHDVVGQIKISACIGVYLDILPMWGGKGSSVEWLAQKLNISPEQIVVAGDSGNDRDMMDRGWKTILVANHDPELADLRSFPHVFSSISPAAAGVLEGLRNFLPG